MMSRWLWNGIGSLQTKEEKKKSDNVEDDHLQRAGGSAAPYQNDRDKDIDSERT